MNDTSRLSAADRRCLWHPFTQMAGWNKLDPVIIESGEDFYLIDTDGNRYIDGVSSLWCNVHGHRVAEIDKAIKDQVDRISHSTLLGLSQTRAIELAQRLVDISPAGLEKVFYSDSGATAVEIAIKMAYQYWHNLGNKTRKKFIALKNSYHGDTVGSVSVGGMELFHGIFHSLLFDTYFVPTPHPYRFDGDSQGCMQHSLDAIEDILKEHADEIAGVIVEPLMQGAAGMIRHTDGFLKGVRDLTVKYGTLLIVDEVATGFGRTGRMFACEHEGVSPDLMCMAKGITGGYLPLAATLATDEIYNAFLGEISDFRTFFHGHTYTGNALGCAAATASLDLFEKNRIIDSLAEKTKMMADMFADALKLDYVGDARQAGMMAGVEIVKDKDSRVSFAYEKQVGAKLCKAMRSKGVMMRPLSDVIVLMPSVGIDIATLGRLLDVVYETLKNDLPKIAEGC